MKKLLFITVACAVFTGILPTYIYAQKQSRVEKLYEYIAKAEREKYDKARPKIDPKSAEAYKNELALGDAFYKLFYDPKFEYIEPYFKSSMEVNQKDNGVCIKSICEECKIKLDQFIQRSDSSVYQLLVHSKDQLKDSRAILEMLTQYNYKILPNLYDAIVVIKEKMQFSDLKAQPTKEKCETYIADFNNKFNYNAVAQIYNEVLYKEVCANKTEAIILSFFDNPTLKTFYTTTKEDRTYLSEVQKIYDSYLFGEVVKEKNPELLKEKIKRYQETSYLSGVTKSYTLPVEYKNDSIDYVVLAQKVDSSAKLSLVKEFLQGHKYKDFLDKARVLREQFVVSTIWSNPTTMKFYSGKKISKESKILNDTVTTTLYNYNEHGFLLDIVKRIEVKKVASVIIKTKLKYNDLGKLYEEESVDSLTKNIVYQATYQYDINGNINTKNAKWSNNRSLVENYNSKGQVIQTQEYENGQIYAQTNFVYNDKGVLSQKIWTNTRSNIDNPVTKQTTNYIYNEYGFLVNASYVKETLQNENISGNTKFYYDEFANEIDPGYEYVYDLSGAWISKVNKSNPNDMEKIEYTYK